MQFAQSGGYANTFSIAESMPWCMSLLDAIGVPNFDFISMSTDTIDSVDSERLLLAYRTKPPTASLTATIMLYSPSTVPSVCSTHRQSICLLYH